MGSHTFSSSSEDAALQIAGGIFENIFSYDGAGAISCSYFDNILQKSGVNISQK